MARPRRTGHPSLEPPKGLEARRFVIRGEELVAFSFPANQPRVPADLTPAEREVAVLIVEGLSNAEIARRRSTAARTVANQIARIFDKLGVGSRSELVTLLLGRQG